MPPRPNRWKLKHTQPRLNSWRRFRKQAIDRWLAACFGDVRPGPVLKTDLFEEASGPFHHASDFPAGLSFFASDVDAAVAGMARELLSREGIRAGIVVADVSRLPFRAATFSALISLSTLDHFGSAT